MKNCIMFLCQDITEESVYRYNKLVKEKLQNYDIYWLTDTIDKSYNINWYQLPGLTVLKEKYKKTHYGWENITTLDEFINEYANKGLHFNVILNYIDFYKTHNSYDFYWFIEFDVFMKNFNELFRFYENNVDTDIICSNLSDQHLTCWPGNAERFKSLFLTCNNPLGYSNKPFKGFFTIARLSNKLMDKLTNYYDNGYWGFFEATIPTLAYIENMIVLDFCTNNFYFQFNSARNESTNAYSIDVLKKNHIVNIILPDDNIIIHPIKLDYKFNDLETKPIKDVL